MDGYMDPFDQLVVLTPFLSLLHLGIRILDQLVVLILNHGFSQNRRTGQRTQLVKEPTLCTNPTTQPSTSSFPRNPTTHPEPVLWLFSITWNPRLLYSPNFLKIGNSRLLAQIWTPHCCCIPHQPWSTIFIFFLCFHTIFNNLSWIYSCQCLNLFWININ